MGKGIRAEVETLHAGQRRAYADSVYECRVTIESEFVEGRPIAPTGPTLRRFAIAFAVARFQWSQTPKEKNAERAWFETYVSRYAEECPGIGVVEFTQPYCD